MSPCTAGQARLARRLPQILHKTASAMSHYPPHDGNVVGLVGGPRAVRSLWLLSEQAEMKRVDLYIKIELELDEEEKPERVAAEICRQLEKMYFVRAAELSNAVTRE
jgi:hypothetical protein